jgi:hypothetical protein
VTAALGFARERNVIHRDIKPESACDPAVFAAAPLLRLAVSAAAMLIPAVRATRVNPVKALTAE